jgi:mono/diheme cytochrome c family protein
MGVRNGRLERVPAALRPGDTDDVLESDRIGSIIRWGAISTIAMAIFLPVYWLQEAGERRATEEEFLEHSVDRGAYYFAMREDPVTGEHPSKGSSHPAGEPFECARCHGSNLEGGTNEFVDPNTGQRRTVAVPELKNVFLRYQTPPAGYRDGREYIRTVIERGRTDGILGVGYDMPSWGVEYGGPLTDQLIEDLLNYLESVQQRGAVQTQGPVDGTAIFAQFCATCHGQNGTGGVGPAMVGGSETRQFPNIEDHVAFVRDGSKPGVAYGASGRGTGGMPPRGGAQLTEEQLRAVVEYERTL